MSLTPRSPTPLTPFYKITGYIFTKKFRIVPSTTIKITFHRSETEDVTLDKGVDLIEEIKGNREWGGKHPPCPSEKGFRRTQSVPQDSVEEGLNRRGILKIRSRLCGHKGRS